ncbi:hypothetical protein YTPLAS73_09080 [Nitrosarchaeum sp.]|nr:hypothetical protein YTPLAS73_09080 [Nitrosarchaeum sp.]
MSSGRDIAEDLHRSMSQFGAEMFQRLLTIIHKRTTPDVADDAQNHTVLYKPEYDVHGIAEEVNLNIFDESNSQEDMLYNHVGYFRRPPSAGNVIANPLTETTIGTGLTFPYSDRKFGGRIDFDGSSYININHNSSVMNVNPKSYAMWLYLPSTQSGDPIQFIFRKHIAYNLHIRAHDTSPNTIRYTSDHSGNAVTMDYVYIPNTWFHIAIKDHTSQELWINKISQATDNKTGGTNTNSQAFSLGANYDGTNKVKSGTRIAWFSWLNYSITQAWIDNHYAGILDTKTASEILTIAGTANEKMFLNCHEGTFLA